MKRSEYLIASLVCFLYNTIIGHKQLMIYYVIYLNEYIKIHYIYILVFFYFFDIIAVCCGLGFECFKGFFEKVNLNEGRMKQVAKSWVRD